MDKIVDHLFIFEGNGAVYDFPGNYSDYRASQKQADIESRRSDLQNKTKTTVSKDKATENPVSQKRSFKEKREFEQLTVEIETLEKEKNELELILSSGTLNREELLGKASRIAELINLIDQKSNRWLELSE